MVIKYIILVNYLSPPLQKINTHAHTRIHRHTHTHTPYTATLGFPPTPGDSWCQICCISMCELHKVDPSKHSSLQHPSIPLPSKHISLQPPRLPLFILPPPAYSPIAARLHFSVPGL